jgi:hypothetical protein
MGRDKLRTVEPAPDSQRPVKALGRWVATMEQTKESIAGVVDLLELFLKSPVVGEDYGSRRQSLGEHILEPLRVQQSLGSSGRGFDLTTPRSLEGLDCDDGPDIVTLELETVGER